MEEKGVMEPAIRSFLRARDLVVKGQSAGIPEESITPAEGVRVFSALPQTALFRPELLAQTVVIKLNGGLGTGMGLAQAKSLLEVRPGVTFLDLMTRQVAALRESTRAQVKFLLMNSQATSADTKAYLKEHSNLVENVEDLEFVQNWAPKLDPEAMEPVSWDADPSQEWCPPGHGDLYPALAGSGTLEALLEEGIRYAFVSNSDNLGATLDPTLLHAFVESRAPFMMEVTRRTESDRKGGHLAVRKEDGRFILREVAQCPDEDLSQFQDISKHQFFNTNNIWLDLIAVKEVMDENEGVLPLPVITNRKTVDPRDGDSSPVIQLEQAMGAAIEAFDGATAMDVPRTRFAPVKTTGDLLALRSDAYEMSEDGHIGLVGGREGKPPLISLSKEYRFVDALEALGVPSLKEARRLEVEGEVSFEEGVIIRGDAVFSHSGKVAAGSYGS